MGGQYNLGNQGFWSPLQADWNQPYGGFYSLSKNTSGKVSFDDSIGRRVKVDANNDGNGSVVNRKKRAIKGGIDAIEKGNEREFEWV